MRIRPLWQTGTDHCIVHVMGLTVVNLDVEILIIIMVVIIMGKMGNVANMVNRLHIKMFPNTGTKVIKVPLLWF